MNFHMNKQRESFYIFFKFLTEFDETIDGKKCGKQECELADGGEV